MTPPTTLELKSEEGLAVGLIDSILTSAELLSLMDLTNPQVLEALKDLQSNKALSNLLFASTS